MQGQRILVTGAAGFIASNLANRLAADNHVIGIDNGHLGTPDHLHADVDFRPCDVLESDLPAAVDVVFHFAALSSYAMHEDDPAYGSRVNVEGFVNTVEQARQSGCEQVVYASTSSIYGGHERPSTEDIAVHSNTAYEASKLARERYAEYFHAHHDLRLAGLRLFSVYQGYGGNEEHKGEYANVIAQFADDIAHGRAPVLYGDGSQTRDFTHVKDVVEAAIAAGEHALHGIYNVGTGESVSFNDLVVRLGDHLDVEVTPKYVDNPIPASVYVAHTQADYSKLHEATGWQPTIDLDEGLGRVCAAYLEDSQETSTLD